MAPLSLKISTSLLVSNKKDAEQKDPSVPTGILESTPT